MSSDTQSNDSEVSSPSLTSIVTPSASCQPSSLACSICLEPLQPLHPYFHCSNCDSGNYNLCSFCVASGNHCLFKDHWLIKRFLSGTVENFSYSTFSKSSTANSRGPKPDALSTTKDGGNSSEPYELSNSEVNYCNDDNSNVTDLSFTEDDEGSRHNVNCQQDALIDLCRSYTPHATPPPPDSTGNITIVNNVTPSSALPTSSQSSTEISPQLTPPSTATLPPTLSPIATNDSPFSGILSSFAFTDPFAKNVRYCNSCAYRISCAQLVTCTVCSDFDLCLKCLEPTIISHHPAHEFVPRYRGTRLDDHLTRLCKAGRGVVHEATCDNCKQVIVGLRYKCLNCPDWDYCSACFSKRMSGHSKHSFAPVYDSLQNFSAVPSSIDTFTTTLIHPYIQCDGPLCANSNRCIQGVRYKCAVCPDTDLCSRCEAYPDTLHDKTHPLIKLTIPVNSLNITTHSDKNETSNLDIDISVPPEGLGHYPSYESSASDNGQQRHLKEFESECALYQNSEGVESELITPGKQPVPPILLGRYTFSPFNAICVGSVHFIRNERTKPSINSYVEPNILANLNKPVGMYSSKLSKEGTSTPVDVLNAKFVVDRILDGTPYPALTYFTQVWWLRNPGPRDWPAGCTVRYVGGEVDMVCHLVNMSTLPITSACDAEKATISMSMATSTRNEEPIFAGGIGMFEVTLRSPARVGSAISYWRLMDPSGEMFGDKLWCHIEVASGKPMTNQESICSGNFIGNTIGRNRCNVDANEMERDDTPHHTSCYNGGNIDQTIDSGGDMNITRSANGRCKTSRIPVPSSNVCSYRKTLGFSQNQAGGVNVAAAAGGCTSSILSRLYQTLTSCEFNEPFSESAEGVYGHHHRLMEDYVDEASQARLGDTSDDRDEIKAERSEIDGIVSDGEFSGCNDSIKAAQSELTMLNDCCANREPNFDGTGRVEQESLKLVTNCLEECKAKDLVQALENLTMEEQQELNFQDSSEVPLGPESMSSQECDYSDDTRDCVSVDLGRAEGQLSIGRDSRGGDTDQFFTDDEYEILDQEIVHDARSL